MKLVVEFDIRNRAGMHEHRSWIVDGDDRLCAVLEAAADESYLDSASEARIINTREASEVDVRLTRKLKVAP